MNTKKYTEEERPDSILYGFAHLLPMEVPFVELKKGQSKFQVEDTMYEMYMEEGYWTLRLCSGIDKYELLKCGSIFKSKEGSVDVINEVLFLNFMNSQQGKFEPPTQYSGHQVNFIIEQYKNSDLVYIQFLKNVIHFMDMGDHKQKAETRAAGFTSVNLGLSSCYLETKYLEEVKTRKKQIAIGRSIPA